MDNTLIQFNRYSMRISNSAMHADKLLFSHVAIFFTKYLIIPDSIFWLEPFLATTEENNLRIIIFINTNSNLPA